MKNKIKNIMIIAKSNIDGNYILENSWIKIISF